MTHSQLSDVVPDEIEYVIDDQWRQIAAPGASLTGAERVAVAARTRGETDNSLQAPAADAATKIAEDPASIDAAWVDGVTERGLDLVAYVEVLGVASRAVALDTFERGIGRSRRPLPAPTAGAPTREIDTAAKKRSGFVPTVGAVGPPTAVNAVPAEAAAQEQLHGALYLTFAGMADMAVVRQLSRPQMELLAARTSLVNDCFY